MPGILAETFGAPTSAMLALNQQIQNFSNQMTSQAKQEFGAASSVFNSLITPLNRIVQGGPEQAGWSNAQTANYNAQVAQQAAVTKRDLTAQGQQSTEMANGSGITTGNPNLTAARASEAAEQQKSAAVTAGTDKSFEAGRENFFKAAGEEKDLPSVFATANTGSEVAQKSEEQAAKSQAGINAADNWWQPLVQKGIAAGASALTGGVAGGLANLDTTGGSSIGEQFSNFGAGFIGRKTSGDGVTAPAITGAVKTPTFSQGGDVAAPNLNLGSPAMPDLG